jgi:hypothetical protein
MTITYPDHSGHRHKMAFASTEAAMSHLRSLEAEDRHEKEIAPSSSGRISIDRWHKMVAFREALGLIRYRYSDEQ